MNVINAAYLTELIQAHREVGFKLDFASKQQLASGPTLIYTALLKPDICFETQYDTAGDFLGVRTLYPLEHESLVRKTNREFMEKLGANEVTEQRHVFSRGSSPLR